jgi:methionyl-tRNA formyltransferase
MNPAKHKTHVGFLFDQKNNWIFDHLGDLTWLSEKSATYDFSVFWDSNETTHVDIVFILGYTRIIPESVLSSIGLSLVIHESALPHGRGFSPVQWQILEGKNEIPVCLIEARAEVDSGDILGTTTIKLRGDELLDEIRSKQAEATKTLIIQLLNDYPNIHRTPQKGEATTYPRRTMQDDRLDPDKTISEQFNHLRIANNELYPAYFILNGVKYLIKITKENP